MRYRTYWVRGPDVNAGAKSNQAEECETSALGRKKVCRHEEEVGRKPGW